MSCLVLGRGTLRATWTPDEGSDLSDEASYQVIEPIRKLITTERTSDGKHFVNPCRLVFGTNAVFKVGVNMAVGDTFDETNVSWIVTSPGRKEHEWFERGHWYVSVDALAPTGRVEIVARFNNDEIQPTFTVPIVQPRSIPVRAFIVNPPDFDEAPEGASISSPWTEPEISSLFKTVNEVYSQIGVNFDLVSVSNGVGTVNDWRLPMYDVYTNSAGEVSFGHTLSEQALNLFNTHRSHDCVEVYFVGELLYGNAYGFWSRYGIAVGREKARTTLPHELGHALGLQDCYYSKVVHRGDVDVELRLRIRNDPVNGTLFKSRCDWGQESGWGFYERSDSLKKIHEELLMYGKIMKKSAGGHFDIPDKSVHGISKYDEKDDVKVGSSFVEEHKGKELSE